MKKYIEKQLVKMSAFANSLIEKEDEAGMIYLIGDNSSVNGEEMPSVLEQIS